MMKKILISGLFILVLFFSGGCSLKKEAVFSGRTMGTTYGVRVVTGYFKEVGFLEKEIDRRLKEINQSMSVYIKDSEISRLNAGPAGRKMPVSDDFIEVLQTAKQLYAETGGAWDGTVGSLVNLWGFGNRGMTDRVPPKDEIDRQRLRVGFHLIDIKAEQHLTKKRSDVFLDLGSIAKGYGVDQIAALIQGRGINDFLVEIGGEVFASGKRKDGGNWRIGINTPSNTASYAEVYKVVPLHNKAMATSGDYRNFFEKDGRVYSHVIDPRSGYPVVNGVVSVSIIADTCTLADGLATAVMVMGTEKGLSLVNRLSHMECLIIVKNSDGNLINHYSTHFPK